MPTVDHHDLPRAGALVAALLLAGCAELDATTDPEHATLSGAFTADRTEADLEDFDATLAAHGIDDYALMESFPEQFHLQMPMETCRALRPDLVEKEYLGHLSGCVLLA